MDSNSLQINPSQPYCLFTSYDAYARFSTFLMNWEHNRQKPLSRLQSDSSVPFSIKGGCMYTYMALEGANVTKVQNVSDNIFAISYMPQTGFVLPEPAEVAARFGGSIVYDKVEYKCAFVLDKEKSYRFVWRIMKQLIRNGMFCDVQGADPTADQKQWHVKTDGTSIEWNQDDFVVTVKVADNSCLLCSKEQLFVLKIVNHILSTLVR